MKRDYQNRVYITYICVALCLFVSGCEQSTDKEVTKEVSPTEHLSAQLIKDKFKGIKFVDITNESGFNYEHEPPTFLTQSDSGLNTVLLLCGGVAAGDYDNDGWVDLYVVRGGRHNNNNLLYRNMGDGSFKVVPNSGLGRSGNGCGPIFADINGDGFVDLFIGGAYERKIKPVKETIVKKPEIFFNRGDDTFEDVTSKAGLVTNRNTISAAFGDYDLDGDLDMFTSHWGKYEGPEEVHIWKNDGDGGFTAAAEETKLKGIFPNTDYSFTPNFTDINNDGWPDLLIVSDFESSMVLENKKDGTFSDITNPLVISDQNGMGSAIGDYDNDGDLDWFISSVWSSSGEAPKGGAWSVSGNRLFKNNGHGKFTDVTDEAGVRKGYWGWGSCFADFDNDSNLDIFHVNGFGDSKSSHWKDHVSEFLNDPSRLFMSNGDGTFTEQSKLLGIDDNGQGRGLVCFDYDRDGDVDIFIANYGEAPKFYRNDMKNDNHFVNIRLKYNSPNSQAIGAKIYISYSGNTYMREIRINNNYVSQNPPEAHFGLGKTGVIDEVKVIWPGREMKQTIINNVSVDQFLVIENKQDRGRSITLN